MIDGGQENEENYIHHSFMSIGWLLEGIVKRQH